MGIGAAARAAVIDHRRHLPDPPEAVHGEVARAGDAGARVLVGLADVDQGGALGDEGLGFGGGELAQGHRGWPSRQ